MPRRALRWLPRAAAGLTLMVAAGWPIGIRADTTMSVPVMSQQNGAWAAAPLGSSPVDTMGSAGCAVTSIAMLLNYYGVATDPAQLNGWLAANGGYANTDDLIWDAVADVSGGRVDFTGWYGADLGLIANELNSGRPVIAEVTLYWNQHFVLITGLAADGGLIIHDPWFGDQAAFAPRYGDPATGIVSIRTFALRSQSGPRGAGGGAPPIANIASLLHQVQ